MNEINLGLNIKKIRLSRGKTQQNIADLLDISQAAYRKFEIDNAVLRSDTLIKIANVFGVPVADLFVQTDKVDENIRIHELVDLFSRLSDNGQKHTLNIIESIINIDK